MAYLIGVVLALGVGGFATVTKLDRDRAFYPTVMIVIALTYALFAAIAGSTQVLTAEAVFIALFVALSVIGFKYSLWFVVAALAAHGILDAIHHRLITNPGVPMWWPPFCLAYDVVAAGYLAVLIVRRKTV